MHVYYKVKLKIAYHINGGKKEKQNNKQRRAGRKRINRERKLSKKALNMARMQHRLETCLSLDFHGKKLLWIQAWTILEDTHVSGW